MKYLILLLISFSAFANFIPISKVGIDSSLTVWTKKSKCEKEESEPCIKIDENYNPEYSIAVDRYVDDLDRPIRKRVEIETCNGEEDCISIMQAKICTEISDEKLYDAEFTEVWCSKITGYEQIVDSKKIAEDASKKLLHEQKLANKEAEKLAKELRKEELKAEAKKEKDLTNEEIKEILLMVLEGL